MTSVEKVPNKLSKRWKVEKKQPKRFFNPSLAQQLSYWNLLSSPRLASIPLYSNIPISPSVPISRYPGEYFDIKKMKWRGLLRVSTWLCFRTCRKDYSNSMKINAQAYSAVSNVSHDNWFWHRGKKKPAMRRKQFYYDRSTLHSPYDSNAWDEKEKSLCWVGERRWSVFVVSRSITDFQKSHQRNIVRSVSHGYFSLVLVNFQISFLRFWELILWKINFKSKRSVSSILHQWRREIHVRITWIHCNEANKERSD